ncbi:unnamed protein product [Lupinus luteus]|uniref:Cystatin domain-containing protein n=1 Tax=Lupinus luteus TaxID=3873 RepID=A0AAV1XPZ3_LUPLU
MAASFSVFLPIDHTDPSVREFATFAVAKHNRDSRQNLKFESVVKAEMKEADFPIYRIGLTAKNGDAVNNYETTNLETL